MRDNLERKMDVKNKQKLSLYRNSPDSHTVGISTQGEDISMSKPDSGMFSPFIF